MNQRRIKIALIILLLVGLGCSLPASILTSPTNTPALPPPTDEEVVLPTATNKVEPEIVPTYTDEPEIEPNHTDEPSPDPVADTPSMSPIGFTLSSGERTTVSFYDLVGLPLGIVQTPGMSSENMHVAGPFLGDPLNIPVIFHTYENNGDIKQTLNGQVTTLVSGPDVAYLQGAPGQNAIVYEKVTWGETLSSYFFMRSASGGGASWFWDRVDPEGWAMAPLAADAENDELQTIFYTLEPWGIGGDIVFPPRKGFFQLNLQNMENILHLTEDFNPIGLSPDNTALAYTEANNNISSETTARITLYNLGTTVKVPIDLAPESNRGGGYAVFSPDNHYVAWMEASGSLMSETPDFHTRVRIANQDGVVIADIPESAFRSVAADPTASWSIPAGWLDSEHLLVEIRGDNWHEPSLMSVRYDGTNMTYLASGEFLGFLYP